MSVQSITIFGGLVLCSVFGLGVYFLIQSREKWKLIARDALSTIDVMRREKAKVDKHADNMRRRLNQMSELSRKITTGNADPGSLDAIRSGRLPY